MSSTSAHLTEWMLEQLAEGTLSAPEDAQAALHLESCGRCRAELDGYRALFAALEGLPRFAPSAGFGDAVMARVRVGRRPSPVLAMLHRWMPTTRRGWTMVSAAVAAPALPVIALVAWVATHPLVSPMSLWQWTTLQAQEGARNAIAHLMTWGSSLGLFDLAAQGYALVASAPLTTLAAVLGILAVAIPLSAWSLVRLTRTPMNDVTYAN